MHGKRKEGSCCCRGRTITDPEINHGDRLITSLGLVLLSEESVAHLGEAKG